MAANRLASNSKRWYQMFSNSNSGTGNKQWLVINSNDTSIEFGVIEQMPGIVSYDELSDTLLSTSYWVSSSNPSLEVGRLNVQIPIIRGLDHKHSLMSFLGILLARLV